MCLAWPGVWWLVRLFGIFVRCLGFYYDISAITTVRAWRGPGEERDTNRQIGERGAGTRILISSDKSWSSWPQSLAWIWRQLRLPGMASVTQSYNIIVTPSRVSLVIWFVCLRFIHRFWTGVRTRDLREDTWLHLTMGIRDT